MPLQLLFEATWSKTYWQIPWLVTVLRVISVLATVGVAFFCFWQLCFERYVVCKSHAQTIAASFSIRMMRQIIFVPFVIAISAMSSMFFPSLAYGLELTISICTVLQVGAVVWHCLDVFGDADNTMKVIAKLPSRRWWCGSHCGGFADAMPYLSYAFGQGKQAKKMTITQLRIAYYAVVIWMTVTIVIAAHTLNFSIHPKLMIKEHGWCFAVPRMEKTWAIVSTVCSIWSALFGMSGFGVIAGASSLAIAKRDVADCVTSKKILYRMTLAQLYVSIPLLKSLLLLLPFQFTMPTVQHFTTVQYPNTSWALSHWTPPKPLQPLMQQGVAVLQTIKTEGVVLTCPLYDREVINMYLYATVVCVMMAFLSYKNWRLNPVQEWYQVMKATVSGNDNDDEDGIEDSQEAESEESRTEVEA